MTANQWKLLFGCAAAVTAFLLVQTDLVLDPIAKVTLGALAVALAVLNPDRSN